MKKICARFILIILLSSPFRLIAQTPRSIYREDPYAAKNFYSQEDMDRLLSTTTVFFYRKPDLNSIDSLKQALTSAWTLTPLLFADISEFDKYKADKAYSYFIIDGFTTDVFNNASYSYTSTHEYITLRVFNHLDEKQQPVYDVLCRIELYPNTHTLFAGSSHRENVIAEFYDHGEFYNWSPVYLAAHLGVVETDLKKEFRSSLFAEVRDPSLTRLLLKDTLYIIDTEFKSFNKFSAREKKSDLNFDRYGAPYRLCSPQELFQIFETEKRGRFLFEYVKSSTDKFVSIYDVKDKKVIYRQYTPISYNLKSKDLAKILNP